TFLLQATSKATTPLLKEKKEPFLIPEKDLPQFKPKEEEEKPLAVVPQEVKVEEEGTQALPPPRVLLRSSGNWLWTFFASQKIDRTLFDLAMQTMQRGRRAADTIPAIGTGAPFPPPKEERLSSDKLVITSYSQDPARPNFYNTGSPTMNEMTQAIFQAHDWSQTYDPAWKYLHENEGKAGVSGRTATYTRPDLDAFDEGVYLFDDLKQYRKGKWKTGRLVVDEEFSLR
ncbi:MAG: hypothetical protein GY768_32595, partial [Planctomycetaceae bacterium]|nr:hypothetical protein [Planctomycetaceae bacterium]